MSLISFLSIARSALLAHQRAMDVTAHNVANAQTPGYSRQRSNLVAADPLRGVDGMIGRGVTDAGLTRARDRFLDAVYRRQSGSLSQSGTTFSFLSRIESSLSEPSDTSITAALDGLFNSFSDLANDPPNPVQRGLVRDAATRLVDQLHRVASDLDQASRDATDQLHTEVDEVNRLTRQIGELNAAILAGGGSTHSAPDLEDRRDQLLDQLSARMSIRVLERPDGTMSVLAGGVLLVEGKNSQDLSIGAAGSTTLTLPIRPRAGRRGSVGSLIDLVNTRLPGIRSNLDMMAKSLVAEVNAIHQTGFTLTGATGRNFFDPAAITAGSIRLDPAIAASTDAIAAGRTTAPGDGGVALTLGSLASTGVASLGGRSMRSYLYGITADVGSAVRNAGDDADAQQVLVDRVDQQRASVSGVSVDEEMAILIGQQQAYSAAAHLIQVAQDMMDDVLQMV
jgi:flagellar hook-associated protein 1 FlgK